jgi:hypothetical protein
MQGRKIICGLAFVALAFMNLPARGSLSATSTIQPIQLTSNSFEYLLTLTNTGTSPIGTFWFGWIPGYDLLPTTPTTITPPTGWQGVNAPDIGVASAQFYSASSPLQPGQTLSGLSFTTSDSPSAIGGTSSFFGVPVEESYIYSTVPPTLSPFTDPSGVLMPTTVTPEPATLGLLAAGGLLLMRRARRR